jgi:hypothetical protein
VERPDGGRDAAPMRPVTRAAARTPTSPTPASRPRR